MGEGRQKAAAAAACGSRAEIPTLGVQGRVSLCSKPGAGGLFLLLCPSWHVPCPCSVHGWVAQELSRLPHGQS